MPWPPNERHVPARAPEEGKTEKELATMRAARMHKVGEPMRIEQVERPRAAVGDAVVRVAACGLVPNLANVLVMWEQWFPYLPLPKLPASFGLDVAGTISEVDDPAGTFKVGDRVYVSPGLSCGSCSACRAGNDINCRDFTFRGYFGFGPGSQRLYDRYPHGGFGEYISAPLRNLIRLPAQTSFEQATRFGYLGTGYSCLRKVGAGPGTTILINGITGTLGLGACLLALALGVTKVLGTGRNEALIKRVEALAPGRIEVLRAGQGSITAFAHAHTDLQGVHGVVDCLAPGAAGAMMQDAIYGIRRGGSLANANGIGEPVTLDVKWMQAHQVNLLGNNWFSSEEGRQLAEMVGAGLVDLSVLQHAVFSLDDVNQAVSGLHDRGNGGFGNYVVMP